MCCGIELPSPLAKIECCPGPQAAIRPALSEIPARASTGRPHSCLTHLADLADELCLRLRRGLDRNESAADHVSYRVSYVLCLGFEHVDH